MRQGHGGQADALVRRADQRRRKPLGPADHEHDAALALAHSGIEPARKPLAGARLAVQSAFRSYSTQKSTFAYWSRVSGYTAALKSSARAGHSEHQLGTTVDFRSYGGSAPWYYSDWGNTKAGAWLKKNAWKYGFIMSYPKG